jgi:hypothetical protein
MAEAGKRPFWMHQLVEYILGGALVASGLQSPTPLVPAALGGLIMLHSAITKGALAAFRVIDRKLHRSLDPVVMAVCAVGALQPWISVDNGTRVIILGITAVHLVVFFGSSFQERTKAPKQAPAAKGDDRSTDIGRTAGRVVGSGVNAVRKMRR